MNIFASTLVKNDKEREIPLNDLSHSSFSMSKSLKKKYELKNIMYKFGV